MGDFGSVPFVECHGETGPGCRRINIMIASVIPSPFVGMKRYGNQHSIRQAAKILKNLEPFVPIDKPLGWTRSPRAVVQSARRSVQNRVSHKPARVQSAQLMRLRPGFNIRTYDEPAGSRNSSIWHSLVKWKPIGKQES